VGNIAARFAFVTEAFCLVGARLCDRKDSALRFGDRERDAILKASESKVSAEGNVAAGPDDLGIEREDAMRPTFVASLGSLKREFINLEEKSVMLGFGVRRLPSVGARQNDVADPD